MKCVACSWLLLFTFIKSTLSENCYYREGKESNDSYLDCEIFQMEVPIQGISLIHLKHNTTISRISKRLLAPFKDLKTLYITAANVESIEPGALQNYKLEIVDLYHNNLQSIENGTFNTQNVLTYLDLSYNKFRILNSTTFYGLVSLEWLSLNANGIRIIKKHTFDNLRSLKALFLMYNRITVLEEDAFKYLKLLEVLDLSMNLITKVPSSLFSGQQRLLKLEVRYNFLSGLPKLIFQNTPSLTVLDISQNQITRLQENLFQHTRELEILRFNDNNITIFNASLFLQFTPHLREVHFFHNHWKCSNLLEMVTNFTLKAVYFPIEIAKLDKQVQGIGCK